MFIFGLKDKYGLFIMIMKEKLTMNDQEYTAALTETTAKYHIQA